MSFCTFPEFKSHSFRALPAATAQKWLRVTASELAMAIDVMPTHPTATLTLCDLPDGTLQQVFDDGMGHFVVGEIACASQDWLQQGHKGAVGHISAPFAPRVRDALLHWRNALLVRLAPSLTGLPWVTWLSQLGISQQMVQIVPIQGTQLLSNPIREHTSDSVASHEIAARSNRHVTSLSYDLVGSTELMRRLGGETYAQLLSQLHRCFADIAKSWGGQADLAQGDDGCMCHFGVLQALERPDLAALQAAWAMAQAARLEEWPVRLGLASGWVVVDAGLPVGLPVHLAARLQKIAPTGQVYVSGTLAQTCQAWFEFQALPSHEVMKGFEQPQSVARLVAPASASVQPQADVDSAILVGRQDAMSLLDTAWIRVAQGIGTDVLVVGEAGIGKSSLLRHWLARQGQARLVPIRCGPHDQRLPFAALAPWIAQQIGYAPSGSRAQRARQLEQCLQTQPLWSSHATAWRHLFDLSPLPEHRLYEEPSAAHRAVIDSVVNVIRTQAELTPVIVAVEDYHWIDASSSEVVLALRHAITSGLHLLLLITQRPPEVGQASYQPHAVRHDLAALSMIQSRELAAQVSPTMGADQAFMAMVNSRAQGVPLFLRECARLYDSPEFQVELHAALRLGVGLPVPESLQSLLMHKLDRLGVVRQLAQVGSVLGEEFSDRLLQVLVDRLQLTLVIGMSLQDACAQLLAQGVWEQVHSAGAQQMRFVHALIRDAAYHSMWDADRKRLHAVVAEVLTELQAELAEANASQLARHLAAAGHTEQAVMQLMEAGKRSKRQGAHQVARETMETALELLELLPEQPTHHRSRAQAHLALAGQIMITEGYGSSKVLDQYAHALALAQAASDDATLLRAQLGMQLCHFMKGDFVQARQHLQAATRVASRVQNPLTTLQCEWALANLEFYEGDLSSSARRMQICIEQCKEHGLGLGLLQNPQVMAMLYRAFSLVCLGRADEGRRLAHEGCALAAQSDNRLAKVQAFGIAAMVAYSCGEWDKVRELTEKACASCAPSEYALWLAHAQVMRGAANARLGSLETGLAQMRQAHQSWAEHGGVLTRSYYWALEADVLVDAMRFDEARFAIAQAGEIIKTTHERYYASEVARIRARIWLADPEQFNAHPQAALELQAAYRDADCRQLNGLALRCMNSYLDHQISQGQSSFKDWQQLQDALDTVLKAGATADTAHSLTLLTQRASQRVISLQHYR